MEELYFLVIFLMPLSLPPSLPLSLSLFLSFFPPFSINLIRLSLSCPRSFPLPACDRTHAGLHESTHNIKGRTYNKSRLRPSRIFSLPWQLSEILTAASALSSSLPSSVNSLCSASSSYSKCNSNRIYKLNMHNSGIKFGMLWWICTIKHTDCWYIPLKSESYGGHTPSDIPYVCICN